MGTQTEAALTPEKVRQLDAEYRPFAAFRSFAAATVDTEIWQGVEDSLMNKRAKRSRDDFDKAVEIAVREAAVDTGAIEGLYKVDRGFTITVATQEEGWEAEFEKKGAEARRLFEAQLSGYGLARNLAKSEIPLNEAWIRRLHAEIVQPQDTHRVLTSQGWQEQALPKGEYKAQSNSVWLPDGSAHAYAPADRVPVEMQRLLEETRTAPFEQAHPVLQAAYAHFAFVTVHPIADGNGRVARALASVFLLQAYGLPLVMYEDQRPDYYDALAASD